MSYSTTPASTALAWLTPEQTAGKEQPFLFTQCEAIHCRYTMCTVHLCLHLILLMYLLLILLLYLHLNLHLLAGPWYPARTPHQ